MWDTIARKSYFATSQVHVVPRRPARSRDVDLTLLNNRFLMTLLSVVFVAFSPEMILLRTQAQWYTTVTAPPLQHRITNYCFQNRAVAVA